MNLKNYSICLLSLFVILCLVGCEKDEKAEPDKINVVGEKNVAVELDKVVSLKAVISGKTRKTALGGKQKTYAADIKVKYELVNSPENVKVALDAKPESGPDGTCTVKLTGIDKPGIYVVKLSLPDYPDIKPLSYTIYGGVVIENNSQDGWVNNALDKPVRIKVEKAAGVPYEGIKLAFDLRQASSGTRLLISSATTNEQGYADLEIKLGKKQGTGEAGLRILSGPWSKAENRPDLKIKFFTINGWTLAMGIIGGLAIFIFGMRMMSDGLSLMAGDSLRKLLNTLTKHRLAAVGTGALITGFIQSSSACSVMVIGFVNAGLMRLEQAIGVIMGANVGTTITAQMISFKLSSLALPAVAIGVLVSLCAKRSGTRFFAQILIGFGLLFLGMQMMAGPFKELRHSQTIANLLHYLDCTPVDGIIPVGALFKAVMAGLLMTVIVQSSSASIGLLITMAGAGLLDVYTAFGVLLGGNIGTTITAVLASIGSSKTAKRTACAHVTFNVVGTILIIASLYIQLNGRPAFLELVSRFTPGDPFKGEDLPRFLANAHTVFNVTCSLIFIWFTGLLALFTRFIISGEDPNETGFANRLLEPHLLATPALAMQQGWLEVGEMLKKGKAAVFASSSAITGTVTEDEFEGLSSEVKILEKEVDRLQTAVTDYVSNISQEALTEDQGTNLPKLLHSVNDAERVGDHAMHLLRIAKRVRKRDLKFSESAQDEIKTLLSTVDKLFGYCVEKISLKDSQQSTSSNYEEIKQLSKKLKRLISDYRKTHVSRHESGMCEIRSGIVYMDLLQNLGRIGDHIFNIIQAIENKAETLG